MNIHKLDYRKLVKISGLDSVKFLQNVLSNDIGKINEKNLQSFYFCEDTTCEPVFFKSH